MALISVILTRLTCGAASAWRRVKSAAAGSAAASRETPRHATDAAGVTVAVTRRDAVVHVDVIDDGQSGLPYWRDADGHDENGRGFHLVNEIAQRWGFLREQAGTCVWFELDPQ